MAKTPPERLAAALKANLKRRKPVPPSVSGREPAKGPDKSGENPRMPKGGPQRTA